MIKMHPLLVPLLGIPAILTFGLASYSTASAKTQLNMLLWCDVNQPAILKPFEESHDVKIRAKTYEGTGAGISILDRSRPGDWDVMEIDTVDVPRVAKGRFYPLSDAKLPLDKQFSKVRMDDILKAGQGRRYAVTHKWGYNAIAYNSQKVSADDVSTLKKLTAPKFKGKIALYNYYLPVLGMASIAVGTPTRDFSAATLKPVKKLMLKLKHNSALSGQVSASQTALATGEVDAIVGAGEWTISKLRTEKPYLKFVIPKKGGILWTESLAVLKDSKHKKLALEFIQYMLSAKGQALDATSACYWGMPAQKNAKLTVKEKKALQYSSEIKALPDSQRYPAPDKELNRKMQDTWTDILQGG